MTHITEKQTTEGLQALCDLSTSPTGIATMADFSLNALDAEIARLEKKIKFGSLGQDIADEVIAVARATRSALDVMARRVDKLEDRTGV